MTSYLLLMYVIFASFKLIDDFCFGNFLLHTLLQERTIPIIQMLIQRY